MCLLNARGCERFRVDDDSTFDFILNTVAVSHDLNVYLNMLKRDGTLTLIGVPAHPHDAVQVAPLVSKRRALAGSLIGGIRETQEMLDFCVEHGKSDVKYRVVIDMATMKQAA